MRRVLLLIVLLVGALALVPAASLRAANGTISGQLVGQNGAANVGGAQILLEIATAAGGKPESLTTAAGADGSFRFADFTFNPSAVYLLRISYDGGYYFHEVQFPQGQTTVDVGGIEVFPATRNSAVLALPRLHTIFSNYDRQNGAQIVETGAYANTSQQAYVGLTGAQDALTYRFGLPRTATGMQVAQGLNRDTLVPISEGALTGFALLDAITPGEHQFAYLYRLPLDNNTLTIDRVFPYATASYTLYLPLKAKVVRSDGDVVIQDAGEETMQSGQKLRLFTASNIPAGGRLAVRFSGVSADAELNPLIPALIIFTLLVGIGLILAYGRRRQPTGVAKAARQKVRTVPGNPTRAGAANGAAEAAPPTAAERKEALLLALVELDEQHERGELADAEYQRLRQERKDELVATLQAVETKSVTPRATRGRR